MRPNISINIRSRISTARFDAWSIRQIRCVATIWWPRARSLPSATTPKSSCRNGKHFCSRARMGEAVKRILITGASAGFGLLTARALCARGHMVWGTSRNTEHLPVLEGFHPIALDLNDPASIDSGFARALAEAGQFDVLINNAGAGVF